MKKSLILFFILFVGIIFRFTGVNWDQNTHLHPDERFLTMVLLDLRTPNSIKDYLDPYSSLLNPTNVRDDSGVKKYSFFVYGTLPLTLTKLTAIFTLNDSYNGITLIGRILSGLSDVLIIILLYKSIQLFEVHKKWDKSIKIWGAFFYAVAVLPIQLSHFFAVDTFLNLFIFASWYFAVRYYFSEKIQSVIASGIFAGLALASKITAVFIIPLIFLIFVGTVIKKLNPEKKSFILTLIKNKKSLITLLIAITSFTLALYLSVRIMNPYMFENSSFINPQINKELLQNWKTLNSWMNKDVWYPPVVQWINTPPIVFALKNIILFGLGIPYALFTLFGMGKILYDRKNRILFLSALWVILFFLYQSTLLVKTLRYFIFLYPFFALFAGLGFFYLQKFIHPFLRLLIILIILIWPLSYVSIYLQPHSRIQASRWIYDHIPEGSTIAWEVWDDPLPLNLSENKGKVFHRQELSVFDYDTPEKWEKMNSALASTDYYILSSNRAWGSLPTVPEKYPLTSKFYKDLFSGKKGFVKIKEFTVYPSLQYLGIPLVFIDDSAEEAFTVYDHPKVIIFKNATSKK